MWGMVSLCEAKFGGVLSMLLSTSQAFSIMGNNSSFACFLLVQLLQISLFLDSILVSFLVFGSPIFYKYFLCQFPFISKKV
jgi:hypothetical protein